MNRTAPIAWALCATLAACASQPKEPPRIMMQGFSIARPLEKTPTWMVARQGPDLTVIGKQGRYSGESFVMQATIVALPAFDSPAQLLRHVESTQRKDIDPKLFRLYKYEIKPQKYHDQTCALSLVEAAERVPDQSTGSPVNTLVETMTLICPHPKAPTRAISMAYTHRHFPEDVDPMFTEEGALLMQTLEFEPL